MSENKFLSSESGSEYEIVSHSVIKGFKIFLVDLAYRTPHMHSDFEINFILDGCASVICGGSPLVLKAPDFFVVNPFTPHEIRTKSPALFLSIQVQASFFKNYFPDLAYQEFHFCSGRQVLPDELYTHVFSTALSMAECYFRSDKGFPLYCASKLNALFYYFFIAMPYATISGKERQRQKLQHERVRRISAYIDEHFSEKLLLSDIAKTEQLSLTYLSHFFKDFFQMSFQEYLLHLRCEKARRLLLLTDHNLLEISLECGFSDMKYFNRGFLKIYGVLPKELRKKLPQQTSFVAAKSLQSTQQILTPEESLSLLSRFHC